MIYLSDLSTDMFERLLVSSWLAKNPKEKGRAIKEVL